MKKLIIAIIIISTTQLFSQSGVDTPTKDRIPSSIHNKPEPHSNQSGSGPKLATTDLEPVESGSISVSKTIMESNYTGYDISQIENPIEMSSHPQSRNIGSRERNRSSRRYNYNPSRDMREYEVPPSAEELTNFDRETLLGDGYMPQIALGEDGTIYHVYSLYDASVTSFLMFRVFKSSDDGSTWEYVGGAYNSSRDIRYPDIAITDDRIVVLYRSGDFLRAYWKKLDLSAYDFVDLPMPEHYVGSWGSIVSDNFYYGEEDTWFYVTYIAHDTTTVIDGWYDNGIFYTHSEDAGVTWSDEVQLSTGLVGAVRPGIAAGYITPEPYTQVDHVIATWRDTLYNGYMAKIDVYDQTFSTSLVLPSSSGDDGWGHYAPAVAGFFDNILITSNVWWGTENGTNENADISMTFSNDGGTTFGGEYSWYYWIDNDDVWDNHPTPAFETTGVLGFAWYRGSSIMYRSNTTLNFLQGWGEAIPIDDDISDNFVIGTAINNGTFFIMYDAGSDNEIYFDSFLLDTPTAGNLSGVVTNAVDGSPIENALVTIGGLSTFTNTSGNYTIEDIPPGYIQAGISATPTAGEAPLSVQFVDQSTSGNQLVTVTKDGYINYTNNNVDINDGQTTVLNISLSPDLDGAVMRFVLNWGDTPLDLDAHLVTPSIGGQPYHVYWNATGSSISPPYAVLDYDVTEGYGPETMTIYDFYSGTYTFYIHNYSESPDLSTSNGTVQIYGESGYITTVAVPANDSGLYWNVCTVDGSNGQVAIVNDLVGSAPALGPPGDYNILKSSPRNQTWSWDFGDNNTSSEQNPTHTYETSGTYDVTLTVSDGSNYSTTIRYEYISVTSGSVSIENEQIPIKFVLHQNHPNPFNPVTTLNYDLQKNGLVTIAIYDMLGKKVKTIINQYQDAGYRTVIWDATNDYGKPVSAGIYLYQIQAGEYLQTKKMVLLK